MIEKTCENTVRNNVQAIMHSDSDWPLESHAVENFVSVNRCEDNLMKFLGVFFVVYVGQV